MSAKAYCLCPRGSNSVRGISRGPKAEEVVVTVQNDGVVVYNVDRRELVNSWALGSQQLKFVTKAVFEPSTRNYYAVVQQSSASASGNHSLLSWPATAASGSLEQLADRHTLTGAVHSIHPISAHSRHTLEEAEATDGNTPVAVVYTDGRVAFGTSASVPVAERVTGLRLLSSHADTDMLAVICKFKGAATYQLDLYDLQGQRHVSTRVFQPPSGGAQLAAASFQQAHLIVMWSTGFLQSYSTALASGNSLSIHTSRRLRAFDLGSSPMVLDHQEDQQHQQEPAQQHTGKKKRKSAAVAQEPAPDSDMMSTAPVPMLVPLGGHSVAAARESTNLPSNGHHSTDLEITVADTQYGCIQSVTSVKLPGSAAVDRAGKDQQEALQLSSGMGKLVLLMHGAVCYISMQAQPATLASLVGALNLRTPTHPAAQAALRALGEEECTSISTPPQVEYARPSWTQSLIQSTEASSSGYDDQAPIAAPATVRWQLDASTQQAQLLEEQLLLQLTHGWSDKEACKSYIDAILKSCKDNKLHLSTQVLASTAAYLAQQQWWGSLDDLLRAQALPSLAMCPGLTLSVVQGGHFSLLATLLPKSPNLPEEELLSILQLLLSPASPSMSAKCKHHCTRLRSSATAAVALAEQACLDHITAQGELSPVDDALQQQISKAAYAAAAVDGLSAQEVCLHGVAAMTHDSAGLLSVLRQLSSSQAVALGQYLLKLMTKYSGGLNDIVPGWVESSRIVSFRLPMLQHVLQWLALLFDAHLTSFHKQAGAVEVLRRLRRLVGSHFSMVQQMSQLRGVTEHLTSKAPVPFADCHADSLYTVELLDLRIL